MFKIRNNELDSELIISSLFYSKECLHYTTEGKPFDNFCCIKCERAATDEVIKRQLHIRKEGFSIKRPHVASHTDHLINALMTKQGKFNASKLQNLNYLRQITQLKAKKIDDSECSSYAVLHGSLIKLKKFGCDYEKEPLYKILMQQMKNKISELKHDGRRNGSRYEKTTAEYLLTNFVRFGPAANGLLDNIIPNGKHFASRQFRKSTICFEEGYKLYV